MLRIYDDCLVMVREVGVLARGIGDGDHARQLRRAALSVALNVAEGSGLRSGNRRLRYESAIGSAREVMANLECADALCYVEFDPALKARLNKIIGTLVNVVR